MKLLSDRASVDELAQQSGALPETVEGRRHSALEGRTASLLNDGRTEREKAQKKEIRDLREALSRATVGRAIAIRAVEEWKQQSRPSRPARSRR